MDSFTTWMLAALARSKSRPGVEDIEFIDCSYRVTWRDVDNKWEGGRPIVTYSDVQDSDTSTMHGLSDLKLKANGDRISFMAFLGFPDHSRFQDNLVFKERMAKTKKTRRSGRASKTTGSMGYRLNVDNSRSHSWSWPGQLRNREHEAKTRAVEWNIAKKGNDSFRIQTASKNDIDYCLIREIELTRVAHDSQLIYLRRRLCSEMRFISVAGERYWFTETRTQKDLEDSIRTIIWSAF